MLYRVSQRTLYRNINTNLSFLTWDMSQLTNQLSSGKKVNKPSDDPAGGATILAMRSILADITQYNKDVSLGDDWLKSSETVLQSMKDAVQQANVLAEQMSTDSYTASNMDTAAEEINKLFDFLVQVGNTKIEDRYIFSGHQTNSPAFNKYLTVKDARADTGNSTLFLGDVVTQGDRKFVARPDIAGQSQNFLVEITSAGGIMSGTSGYSLARLTVDPSGVQNGLFFMAKDNPAYRGTGGNGVSIRYSSAVAQTSASITVVGNTITVNLGTSGGAITTTAQEIMNKINHNAVTSGMITAYLQPGNSGLGKVTTTSAKNFSGGYNGPAMYRVSQDGGLTWSVPNAFTANDLRGNNLIYNPQLGHANLTTSIPGLANDLHLVANQLGTHGNDIRIQYLNDQPAGTSATTVTLDPIHWNITVHLANSAGAITSTANDVMNAINGNSAVSHLVTAELADYREGGNGRVSVMELKNLSNGGSEVTALGYAKYRTQLTYGATGPNPNIEFTALAHGPAGNNVQIAYSSAVVQNFTSYSAAVNTSGITTITVHLATNSAHSILAVAQDVVDLFTSAYIHNPASALVMADLVGYPGGKTATLSLLGWNSANCCSRYFRLSGGDASKDEANYGVNIRFVNDGTFFPNDRSPLSAGDRFAVDVGYYLGDDQAMNVNANRETQIQINTTGGEALGDNGASDNILDTLSRLAFALRKHDSTKVGAELPKLNDALDKLSSQMARVGVRLTRNQFVTQILSGSEENSTERMSRYEDLDYEQAITALQTSQTAYQATLAATAMITKLSLADYIK